MACVSVGYRSQCRYQRWSHQLSWAASVGVMKSCVLMTVKEAGGTSYMVHAGEVLAVKKMEVSEEMGLEQVELRKIAWMEFVVCFALEVDKMKREWIEVCESRTSKG